MKTLWRGLIVRVPGRPEDYASPQKWRDAVLGVMQAHAEGLGRHWSRSPDVAERFARGGLNAGAGYSYVGPRVTSVGVVFEAQVDPIRVAPPEVQTDFGGGFAGEYEDFLDSGTPITLVKMWLALPEGDGVTTPAGETKHPLGGLVEVPVSQTQRTAVAARLPDGYTLHYTPGGNISNHQVAVTFEGKVVGHIQWVPEREVRGGQRVPDDSEHGYHMESILIKRPPQIVDLKVAAEHRRKGLATSMYEEAKRREPDLVHDDIVLPDGQAWMESLGFKNWRGEERDDIKPNPDGTTTLYRTESKDVGFDFDNPPALGVHWTTYPWDFGYNVYDGDRVMWYGQARPEDVLDVADKFGESEVVLKPGATVRLTGRTVREGRVLIPKGIFEPEVPMNQQVRVEGRPILPEPYRTPGHDPNPPAGWPGTARHAWQQSQSRPTQVTYDLANRVRPAAQTLTLEQATTLARRILTDAGFPHGDEAEAIRHPSQFGTSSVAWDVELQDAGIVRPLIALSLDMQDELTTIHECAHIVRNGTAWVGKAKGDEVISHDDQWFTTFARMMAWYATNKCYRQFQFVFGTTPSVSRTASAGQTFFHGSAHEFEPDTMLNPRQGDQGGEHVFLADSPRVAGLYAQLAAGRMHGLPVPNDRGLVYEVEPLGDVEPDPVQEWGGEYRTTGEVRVLRRLGSGRTASWTPFQPPEHIKITSGGDAVPGGYNGYYVAYDRATGNKMGYLDYQSAKEVEETEVGTPVTTEYVTIAMVEVEPEFRRQGVATVLLNALRNDFPDAVIDPGMTTPDGTAWWSRVGSKTATDWLINGKPYRDGVWIEVEPEVNPHNTPWFTDDGRAWVNTLGSKTSSVTPDEGETIYRGLALRWSAIEEMEGISLEEFFAWPPGDIASWIIDRFDGVGTGHHWSTDINVSLRFANEVAADIDGFPVVIEGTYTRATVDLEDDESLLSEMNVYTSPDDPEKEVTIREGSLIPVNRVHWVQPDGTYGALKEAAPSWNNTVTASKTAGPADDYIPGHMRGPSRVAPTEMPMPRPVVVDRPAEEDLEDLPSAMRAKLVDAVRDIEDGAAPLEAKERELTGVYTMRLSNAWRAAFYMGREGFWHLMYVGPHDYVEVAKRWTRTSAKTAAPAAGPMPDDIEFRHFTYPPGQGASTVAEEAILAYIGNGTMKIGGLYWCANPEGQDGFAYGEVTWVVVNPFNRRQGIATEMLRRAREIEPKVHHSSVQSHQGREWAQVAASKRVSPG